MYAQCSALSAPGPMCAHEICTLTSATLKLIQKLFTEKVHGNFHVLCNIETTSEIPYRKGPWKFPCTLQHYIETNSEILNGKGPWKISSIL